MTIPTYYYGDIPIEAWEFPAFFLLMIGVWLISGYIRRQRIATQPEYKYFLYGLWAKILGGLGFGVIYIFYYRGGDTIGYFASAYAYCELFYYNTSDFFLAYFGPVKQETLSLFSQKTGEPLGYMYFNDQTRVVIKLVVPFLLLAKKSYFIAGALISILTYTGAWRLYQTFVRHFPGNEKKFAIAILFMPSVVFWGSGISKDSFTLAGACFVLSSVSRIIEKKGNLVWNVIVLLIAAWVVMLIKPYILLILLPGTLIWILYSRIRKIRNALIRYSVVPFTYVIVIGGSYGILSALGGSLGKFSIDKALETASITQRDLKQDYYQGNSFDIGEFEPTIAGVAGKFVPATIAGLYRPYLLESRNVVMLLSGLENLFILLLTIYVVLRVNWIKIYTVISDHPILMCSFIFSILFAFLIGLTTANFGAMVRFKIPLVPLYVSTMMVLYNYVPKSPKRIGKVKSHR
jgi:hypothetical protein